MYVIEATNVNDALTKGIVHLLEKGDREDSRNGTVLVAPTPVVTVYNNPTQRVLFSPLRDANPFFHLMESLWMLAGDDSLAFPMYFNSRFAEYSDDGQVVHGAYGHRWRNAFGFDQLSILAAELSAKPNSRRAVLQMWSAYGDLQPLLMLNTGTGEAKTLGGLNSKDVPCNTHAYFDLRGGKLNMTVCNRSNDIIWGAYGANAVHFSVMQEYLASMLLVDVGVYRQISNNFHAYTDVYSLEKLGELAEESSRMNQYSEGVTPFPLVNGSIKNWEEDLKAFMRNPGTIGLYNDEFFNGVVFPMYKAYSERKNKNGNGQQWIEKVVAPDWQLACTQWISRREKGN